MDGMAECSIVRLLGSPGLGLGGAAQRSLACTLKICMGRILAWGATHENFKFPTYAKTIATFWLALY